MCIFKVPKPKPPVIPPAITPTVDTDTSLPSSKDVLDEDDTADVEYGSKKKKEDPTLGTEKKGSDALKISLNQGATGSGTGGVNQP